MSGDAFRDPRDVLREHGLWAKRRFSQNFLTSAPTVRAIARALALSPGERCVELGPGLGTLTHALLSSGAEVVGIEKDRDMLSVLAEEFRDEPRFRAVEADAARVDITALGGTRELRSRWPETSPTRSPAPSRATSSPKRHISHGRW